MCDYGILKQRPVFKKSPLIGKNSTKAYLTWPSILQDLTLQVQELMLWPKFLFENSSQWKIIIFRSEIWKESRNLPRYSRVPKWIIMLWWWKNELIKITKKKKEHCFPCEKLQQPNSYLQQQQYTLYIKWLPKKTFLKRILKSALSLTSI